MAAQGMEGSSTSTFGPKSGLLAAARGTQEKHARNNGRIANRMATPRSFKMRGEECNDSLIVVLSMGFARLTANGDKLPAVVNCPHRCPVHMVVAHAEINNLTLSFLDTQRCLRRELRFIPRKA